MHDFNIKMIKTLLTISVVSLIVIMVGGMSILKDNYYWSREYAGLQWNYIGTELDYIDFKHGGIIKWIFSSEKDKNNPNSEKDAKSIPVLLYHGIINDPNWQPDGTNIRADDFKKQMFALKAAGYQTVKISEYLDFINGKRTLPEKSFVLTFDDGRRDSFLPADPILRTLDYTAVMCVITGRSLDPNQDNSFHLSTRELKAMVQSGRWEMESHGRNDHDEQKISIDGQRGHFLTNKLWIDSQNRLETEDEFRNRITEDLIGSKKDLEKNIGTKVVAFAYPFGDYGQGTQNFPENTPILAKAAKNTYEITFYQAEENDWPGNYPGDSPMSKRINADSSISAKNLIGILDKSRERSENYKADFVRGNDWIRGWGSLVFEKGMMILGNTSNEDSSMAYLSGSKFWEDYTILATIRMLKGDSFAMLARFNGEGNNFSCEYSSSQVALIEKIAGQDRIIIEKPIIDGIKTGENMGIKMEIKKDMAYCYLKDNLVATGIIGSSLKRGGIGFMVWDSSGKENVLAVQRVRTISVDPSE